MCNYFISYNKLIPVFCFIHIHLLVLSTIAYEIYGINAYMRKFQVLLANKPNNMKRIDLKFLLESNSKGIRKPIINISTILIPQHCITMSPGLHCVGKNDEGYPHPNELNLLKFILRRENVSLSLSRPRAVLMRTSHCFRDLTKPLLIPFFFLSPIPSMSNTSQI